jgi:hypothetical protein
MSRESSYLLILEAAAKHQASIASILEAKAREAEKACHWICKHMHPSFFPSGEELHKQSMEVHGQIVELIEGITRMEQGLGRNLRVFLSREEPEPFPMQGMGGAGGVGEL